MLNMIDFWVLFLLFLILYAFYFCKLSFDYFKNWQVEVKLAAFIFKTNTTDAIMEKLAFLSYADTLQILAQ